MLANVSIEVEITPSLRACVCEDGGGRMGSRWSNPVVLNQGLFCLSGDIWQCLGTLLIIMTRWDATGME